MRRKAADEENPMARGGARNRSGPQKDEKSERSEKAGYIRSALPPTGYDGAVPDFPLPRRLVYRWEFEDKRKFQVYDSEATDGVWERELELWAWAWSQPQACAWSMDPWRWPIVGMWVRTFVVCEGSDATAADKGSLHRFADQIGMTPAGLKENGWAIKDPEVKPAADEPATPGTAAAPPAGRDPRKRFKVVGA